MKKCFLTLLLVAMFSLVACNFNEAQVAVGTAETNQEAIVNGKVPFARAISNADFVFKNIESLNYKKRKVKSVDVLTKSSSRISRSSLQDEQEQPLAYVVNYENNEGYAILAANTKLPPVISIGDEGNFNTEGFVEFTQNSGNTRSGTSGNLNPAQEIQYALVNNSLIIPPIDFGDFPLMGRDTTVILKCLPLVSTKWGQREPYNYYSDTYVNEADGDTYLGAAGCVPVAGAQVLASLCYHHNWQPTTQLSEVFYMDWSAINKMLFNDIIRFSTDDYSENALSVASFIRAVGESVNAQYGWNTGANTGLLVDTYQTLGIIESRYGSETYGDLVTKDDIFSMIVSKNYPVNARAKDANSTGGHSFVLDGWLRLEYSLLFSNSSEIDPGIRSNLNNVQYNFDLVHVNFGWNGENDGYYMPDAFNLTEDKYREYAENNDVEHYSTKVYDLNVRYLIYDL